MGNNVSYCCDDSFDFNDCGGSYSFQLRIDRLHWLLIFVGPDLATKVLRMTTLEAPQNFVLLAVPMFILTAELLVYSGIGTTTYNGLAKVFSGVNGGLAYATITMFTAMEQLLALARPVGAIGPAAIKEMTERRYAGWLAQESLVVQVHCLLSFPQAS